MTPKIAGINAHKNVDLYHNKQKLHSSADKEVTQKLIQTIHQRVEEKFGDYRKAFRALDKNFDGSLSFQEFVSGCEFSGIKMTINDFKKVFDIIDYDSEGEVDF